MWRIKNHFLFSFYFFLPFLFLLSFQCCSIKSQKDGDTAEESIHETTDYKLDNSTDKPAREVPDDLDVGDEKKQEDTPVVGGCSVFPPDNPWNTDISEEEVDPDSDVLIASIGLEGTLHPDFGTVWRGAPNGIPYVVVGPDQPLVDVSFRYADESDPGPYPIPPDAPIEGGRDSTGDRHVIVVQSGICKLFELFDAWPQPDGSWEAGSGAIFDLSSNALRPDTWTSADAAGLPILPGLVKYEEAVEKGEINHALRFTVRETRRAFIHPATHWASSNDDPTLPPMGMRVRLKSDFDITPFPPEVQVILRALKKYGMFVADNGADWYISGAPDPRWNDDALHTLHQVEGRNFEVVKMGKIYTPEDF